MITRCVALRPSQRKPDHRSGGKSLVQPNSCHASMLVTPQRDSMPSQTSTLPPIPPPVPVETHPYRAPGSKPPEHELALPDPDLLAPEDAYFAPSLSRARSAPINYEESLQVMNGDATAPVGGVAALRSRALLGADGSRTDSRKRAGVSRRRRRKGAWKKLLWVKQSCTSAMSRFFGSRSAPTLTNNHRPGQLYRQRNIPRPSPAESPRTPLRLLASSG